MAALTAIEEALRVRLATIAGVRAYAEQPDTVNPPCLFPIPREGDYHESFGGTEMTTFDVVVLAVGFDAGYRRGQNAVDVYLARTGARSIKAAIEADRTLNDVAQDVNVTRWFDRGAIEINGVEYWGAKVEVQVWH